jgi:hypothetical protein
MQSGDFAGTGCTAGTIVGIYRGKRKAYVCWGVWEAVCLGMFSWVSIETIPVTTLDANM